MSDRETFSGTTVLIERESEDRFWLNMGPQHPSTHGVFRILLETEGEVVTRVVPVIGYLHRGVEKLSENREWMGAIPLTDRMDYLSAIYSNMALVQPVETLMGIEVPERAQWLRVLSMEINRLASHLLFYGTMGLDLGALTPFFYAFRQREKVQYLLELLSGQRITHNYIRYGGVRGDLTPAIEKEIRAFVEGFVPALTEMEALLSENEIFRGRMKGLGVTKPDFLESYAVTGPILRAAGVDWDLRRDSSYAAYDKMDFNVPVHQDGDCYARWWVRFQEMVESTRIIQQCLDGMPAGKFKKPLPFFLKVPRGEIYQSVDTPRGDLGVYVVSDGSRFPYRIHYRAPSFCNLSAIPSLIEGEMLADVVAILGSFDPVFGEVDR
ncbi:NADH-quinone oxidoreductase subunit D [bacterium]|nr:NADH-quinone oxidoreductase subunit D [bacterium]